MQRRFCEQLNVSISAERPEAGSKSTGISPEEILGDSGASPSRKYLKEGAQTTETAQKTGIFYAVKNKEKLALLLEDPRVDVNYIVSADDSYFNTEEYVSQPKCGQL